jgi:hypothetical protein
VFDALVDAVALDFTIPPAGSLLLFIPVVYNERHITPVRPRDLNPLTSLAPMKISRDRENVVSIEFCDLTLGGETTNDMHSFDAADKVYKFYGFKNGNPWNTSVQFKTRTTDRDTFGINTGFTATYHFTTKNNIDFSTFQAVIERPDLWSVSVNGKEVKPEEGKWWLDREFGVFNIGDMVKGGDNTVTLKTSPMKIHAEIEPIYITGDFSALFSEKGFAIGAPVKELTQGSWKEQGMPFYSLGVTYSKEFNIENAESHFLVNLNNWNGTIAEVTVNGSPAGVIAFPPYECDVTDLIRQGINKIDVKVIGSNKNLLGPHFNNPKPGLVSPGHFRNVKSYPAGRDYQLIDYGLMEDFKLLTGK